MVLLNQGKLKDRNFNTTQTTVLLGGEGEGRKEGEGEESYCLKLMVLKTELKTKHNSLAQPGVLRIMPTQFLCSISIHLGLPNFRNSEIKSFIGNSEKHSKNHTDIQKRSKQQINNYFIGTKDLSTRQASLLHRKRNFLATAPRLQNKLTEERRTIIQIL